MSMQDMHYARRDMHRASMKEYGPEIEWLKDPGLIPESAAATPLGFEDTLERRCASLANWMVEQLGIWTVKVHDRIDVGSIYANRNLGLSERAFTIMKFLNDPYAPYLPGMMAVASIHAAIPGLATREERPKGDWAAVGEKAEGFGYDVARYGTDVQAAILQWIRDGSPIGKTTLNVAKLKLDEETGLTTTTPFDDVLGTARHVAGELNLMGLGENTCVALNVSSPVEGSDSLFGATWSAYGSAANNLIYPDFEIDPDQIPPEEEAWNISDVADFMSAKLIEDHEELRRQLQR